MAEFARDNKGRLVNLDRAIVITQAPDGDVIAKIVAAEGRLLVTRIGAAEARRVLGDLLDGGTTDG